MLIHLLVFLLKQASKTSEPPSLPTRVERGEKVVIHCPNCGTLALADEIFIQQRASAKANAAWIQLQHLYDCNACHRRHAAPLFENDGHGILIPIN